MRYSRLDPLNVDMERLQDATVAVVGLGATGSHIAENLARLGADLVLIDRDWLESQNLSTSALYTEEQVEEHLPKTVAAQEKLTAVNSDISVDLHLEDLNSSTYDDLLADADLIMDGTDNLETRFLINEYSVRMGTPWVHVSALGYSGEVMPVTPQEQVPPHSGGDGRRPSDLPPASAGACFNCIFADKDGAELETCETAGVLKETAATAANIATMTATAMLSGEAVTGLTRFNLKNGAMRTLNVERREDCRTCTKNEYPYLTQETGSVVTALCGKHKYQIRPQEETQIDLVAQAGKLQGSGDVVVNDQLLRFESDDASFTLFRSGRAIIDAENEAQAKSVYSKFIGN